MKPNRIRPLLIAVFLGLAGLTQACGTLYTTTTGVKYIATGEPAPTALPYTGTLVSTACFLYTGPVGFPCLLDIPMSLTADTAMLSAMPYLVTAQGLRYGYENLNDEEGE